MSIWATAFIGLSGVHVNMPEADGTTALHWAVRRGHTAVVRLLLVVGANANAANDYGVTPLSLAASNGNAPDIEALLNAGADANASLAGGITMLMLAAGQGNSGAVNTLVSHGARVDASEPVLGETALIWAAKENHPDAIEVLVRGGANLEAQAGLKDGRVVPGDARAGSGSDIDSTSHGSTALTYAIRSRAAAAARKLITLGANPNVAGPNGTTPLQLAIISEQFDIADLLLVKGADPNKADQFGVTPIYAATDGHTLTSIGDSPDSQSARRRNGIDIVKALLQHGANPNVQLARAVFTRGNRIGDQSIGVGVTPFMRAAWMGDVTLMQLLMDHGADSAAVTKSHETALMFAAGFGGRPAVEPEEYDIQEDKFIEAARLCLQGETLNMVNSKGQSALHFAAAQRGPSFVKFLVKSGAKIGLKDHQGRTALEVSVTAGRDDIAELLRQPEPKGQRMSAQN
jgi:ankyrin repeat protein